MTIQDKPIVIQGLLIAAGASRRLGQPKQLVWYKGNYLINHTIDKLINSDINDLIVVLGSKSELIGPLIKSEAKIIINNNWESGMGSSIGHGIKILNNNVDGVLISLVDQYTMTKELTNSLIKEFNNNPNKLIVSKYRNDVHGPPAIFPNRLFANLQLLDSDRGAGKIIQNELSNHPDQVVIVDFENGYLDIDSPEDLLNLFE